MPPQPGILAPCAPAAHFLAVRLTAPEQGAPFYEALRSLPINENVVAGLGAPLAGGAKLAVPGLRAFPVLSRPDGNVPSTQVDAWFYVRGGDSGETLHAVRALLARFPDGIEISEDVPAFKHAGGRDLSGYEDGTENPREAAAALAAFVQEGALAGSSFVAVQRWVHDLAVLDRLDGAERDAIIGRRRDTNEEIADAPESAHVKRTAQESFDPSAFMLRRSMPYGGTREHGLYFVAFGADLDRFERMLRRMVGEDDGVTDALFRFSRPVSGGYYWCPPVGDGFLLLPELPA